MIHKLIHSRTIKWLTLASAILLSGCSSLMIAALNQQDLTKVTVQGKKMYLLGVLNSKSKEIVTRIIDKNPQVTTLVLTANAGSIDDETTFSLGRYIRDQGLNTYLLKDSVIASGAVDLFLAGNQRFMEHGAKLGVHSWDDGSNEAIDYPRNHLAHDLNASYIRDMLGDDAFYWFTIEAAPASGLHWMRQEEIARFDILTTRVLPAGNELTPFGQVFLEMRADLLDS